MTVLSAEVNTLQLPIPIMSLQRQYEAIGKQLEAAAIKVLQSGVYILGSEVRAFEATFAQRTQCKYAIGVANGTDSLYLALRALGVGEGDEVITTSFSYIATSEAIVRTGATPVFTDLADDGTYLMAINSIESLITQRTKAILPVHLYGQACDMDAIMAIANKHQLGVVEDCAQAVDATWNGKPVGSFGDFGSFSFFPTKNLGCAGDGGLLTCQDDDLAGKVRSLRVHGQNAFASYNHTNEGMNSRLDEIQAAILTVKLPYLTQWSANRNVIATKYTTALKACKFLVFPTVQKHSESVFHQYTVALTADAPLNREAVLKALEAKGIMARVYYPITLPLQGMHANLGIKKGQLPVAERLADTVFSLPMFPELLAEEQAYICETLLEILG
jgi:dTDP-4-amino-4,6-dideoxygalactose transaminase